MKDALYAARVEKDVENTYREAIRKERPKAVLTSPHGTDGYAEWSNVRLLLEAKFDLDFKARIPVCNTLGQCLLYLKRFEQSGEPLPNVILVGDKNECFVLSTTALKGFLDLPLDWSVAPSKGNPALTRALVEGMNILPYVYDVGGSFNFRDVLEKIEALAKGEQHTVKASLVNIGAIFAYWRDRVFHDARLTPVEQVDVFLRCLFHPTDVYLHPTKLGVLVVPGYPEGVTVVTEQYRSFFDHFEQGYKPSEVEAFYATKDRLVADDARRRQGAFFTPDLWVAEAHKSLEKVLGPNWREECIVWDPAAGTANLTRDYTFRDLIVSTAEKPDVLVVKDQGYNPGAAVFQYDFLNPEEPSPFFEEDATSKNTVPDAVEDRLKAAAKSGKRLVFLMNPPYGTANDAGTKGTSKAGIALTTVNKDMKRAKLGGASQQLYAQFMYQCSKVAQQYGFARHTVALFSNPKFMASGSYRPFRQWWYGRYEFRDAFMFQASHFADVSGRWGISFTVWDAPGKTDLQATVPCVLKDVPKGTFAVENTGTKALYNSDDREASAWVREPLGKAKGADAPQFSSGLKVKATGHSLLLGNALAFAMSKGNSLMESGSGVAVVSAGYANGHGFSVLPSNFRRAIALYAARKLVAGNWVNDKDEYLTPHAEGTPDYEQWVDDCHAFNLLHNSNNCTAMRNVRYGNREWQIHNHFFWKPYSDALKAFDTKATGNLYRDCKAHPSKDVFGNPVVSTPDPYMASVLPSLNISPEAKAVLARLDALWTLSLPHRESYAAGKPELHLTAWDAGLFQLKHIWRDLFPVEWADLQTSFKALADKLRPGVYKHGFLKP